MRLTNEIRSKIIKGSIENLMSKKYKDIEELEDKIYSKIIDYYLSVTPIITQESCLTKSGYINIRLDRKTRENTQLPPKNVRKIPCNFDFVDFKFYKNSTNDLEFYKDILPIDVQEMVDDLVKIKNNVERIRKDMRNEIYNIVYGCNTDIQLKKIIPDIETISGVSLQNKTQSLINFDTTKLNELIYSATSN